jgi:hypothetical protein
MTEPTILISGSVRHGLFSYPVGNGGGTGAEWVLSTFLFACILLEKKEEISMPQLLSARVPETTAERFRQFAKRKQRSVNEMMGIALEEWLRQQEFAGIEFRDTPDGRIAYMKESRLAVYWVVKIVLSYGGDLDRAVTYFDGHHSREWVQTAMNYYEAFPEEIDAQITYADHQGYDTLKRRLPQLRLVTVTDSEAKYPE